MPYSYSVAAKYSGVQESTLRNRCDQGLAPLFTGHQPGKHRRFAIRDVIALAVMDEIAARGLSLWDAANITKDALNDLDKYCVSTGRDDPSDVETVGLNKRVLFLWTNADGRWQWRCTEGYAWPTRLAWEGIGQTDIPRSAIAIYVHSIVAEVVERIREGEATKKKGAK